MDIPRNRGLLTGSFEQFTHKALNAMRVRASIAELKLVSEKLDKYLVDSKSAETFAPYEKELQQYMYAGYSCEGYELKQLKASMTVWTLYNAVTDYASNNPVWSETDNRRGMLQDEALKFLMRERDVKNYGDIFANNP